MPLLHTAEVVNAFKTVIADMDGLIVSTEKQPDRKRGIKTTEYTLLAPDALVESFKIKTTGREFEQLFRRVVKMLA
ncbi:hypothetical protein HYZ05_02420 [Candidatus Daviesbacteria bacterium]|nr:hypothetical protein [Candidatus Daviesbacteria bacterium]